MSFQTCKCKIFWMRSGSLVTVPLTAKQLTLSRPRKVWKTFPKWSICHQWFNRNVMKPWYYFLYAKKTKLMTLRHFASAYHHFGEYPLDANCMLFCVSCATQMKTTPPCGAADTEQHMQFASSGYSPKWCNAYANWQNNKYNCFLSV